MSNNTELLSKRFLECLSCRVDAATPTVIFAFAYVSTVTTRGMPWRSVVSDSMSLLLSIDCKCHLPALPSKGDG